jgi:hypothetical protein
VGRSRGCSPHRGKPAAAPDEYQPIVVTHLLGNNIGCLPDDSIMLAYV